MSLRTIVSNMPFRVPINYSAKPTSMGGTEWLKALCSGFSYKSDLYQSLAINGLSAPLSSWRFEMLRLQFSG